MKILRYFGLMVIVVCLTAFASGCGGGGGSAMMEEEMPPVMVDPVPDPGPAEPAEPAEPTDADKIAEKQGTLADIVDEARVMEAAALAAYRAVILHPDATDAQIDLALDYALEAQTLLAEITAASAAANAATTPELAESELAKARESLGDLILAQTGAESIQIALQTPATPPPGQTETAFTGGSPLIQHVRDNSIINEAVLSNLATGDLAVSAPPASGYSASFPANTGSGSTLVRGELSVTAMELSSVSRGTTALPSISGIGSGFDIKQEASDTIVTTTYVNAYTDISQTRSVKIKTELDGDATKDGNQPTFVDREMPDSDYLLLGIWLTVPSADTSMATMGAFAYGGRAIPTTIANLPLYDPNDRDLETDAELNMENTGDDAVSFGITDFVDDNKDLNATYRGKVVGAYLVGGKAANLEASIELEAEFRNIGGATGEGDISGTISSIMAGGQSIDGYIDLVKPTSSFANVTGPVSGDASGVVANEPFSGAWQGQFFEPRYKRTTEQVDLDTNTEDEVTRIVTKYVYTPEAPGTFAGAFQVRKSGVADAGIIGAFGAKR